MGVCALGGMFLLWLGGPCSGSTPSGFERTVLPFLENYCHDCHDDANTLQDAHRAYRESGGSFNELVISDSRTPLSSISTRTVRWRR